MLAAIPCETDLWGSPAVADIVPLIAAQLLNVSAAMALVCWLAPLSQATAENTNTGPSCGQTMPWKPSR
jgi:hypothetical protein